MHCFAQEKQIVIGQVWILMQSLKSKIKLESTNSWGGIYTSVVNQKDRRQSWGSVVQDARCMDQIQGLSLTVQKKIRKIGNKYDLISIYCKLRPT